MPAGVSARSSPVNTRLAVSPREVDQDVAAQDQVEGALTERRHRITDDVVEREGYERAQRLAHHELVSALAEVALPERRPERACRAWTIFALASSGECRTGDVGCEDADGRLVSVERFTGEEGKGVDLLSGRAAGGPDMDPCGAVCTGLTQEHWPLDLIELSGVAKKERLFDGHLIEQPGQQARPPARDP